jgi:predicted patatin/cPLA2 family phospholipase
MAKHTTALDLVKQRMHKPRRLSLKKDNTKLCLAVEGGGFTGVISMGMLMALKDLNLLRVFDEFVGCSAGGLNLAYILGGKDEIGLSVYYDHVINHKFFDPKRLVRGKYIMDMAVLEKIMRELVPLPYDELLAHHPSNFHVCLTNVDTNEGELITVRQAKNELLNYMLAGSTIPYFSGEPRVVRGTRYFDGTFAYPDLSIAAEALGCTHALILSTNPDGGLMADRYDNIGGKSYQQVLARSYPDMQELWKTRLEYSRHLETIKSDLKSSRIIAQLVAIPRENYQMGGFSRDQWMIIDGARKGYQAIVNLFHPDATVGLVPEIL